MSDWYRIDRGTGRPLVLLHGGGGTTRTWLPVLDELAAHRRVLAFDFPGFGRTPWPENVEYSMNWLVSQLVEELAAAGIETPVDIVGNSMGGWVALEAAKRGVARSVVALGPAGLWSSGMPPMLRSQFFTLLLGSRAIRGREESVLSLPGARTVALSQLVAKPRQVPIAAAVGLTQDFDASRTALVPLLRLTKTMCFEDGQAINAPVTIAYGSRERMLRKRSGRVRNQLPAHTRWLELPNCGHVPMWDDPELVARIILEGTSGL